MKIKDRLWLSIIAGIGGTVVKSLLIRAAKSKNWAEFDGAETSAGMLLPAHKVLTPAGRAVGELANLIVGVAFSVPIVYMLSLTGKDKAVIKGAGASSVLWVMLYGSMANLGLSTIRPAMPPTMLTQCVCHGAFGAAVALLATGLGDPGLFDGTIPVFVKKGDRAPRRQEQPALPAQNPFMEDPEELPVTLQ